MLGMTASLKADGKVFFQVGVDFGKLLRTWSNIDFKINCIKIFRCAYPEVYVIKIYKKIVPCGMPNLKVTSMSDINHKIYQLEDISTKSDVKILRFRRPRAKH